MVYSKLNQCVQIKFKNLVRSYQDECLISLTGVFILYRHYIKKSKI